MAANMDTVIIIYSSDSPETKAQAEELRAALDPARAEATLVEGSRSSFTNVAAADIVVLGGSKTADIPSDFSEIVRASQGANLAGKTAAFFSPGPDRTSAKLRKALRDSDITVLDDDLVLQDGNRGAVKAWTEKLLKLHEAKRHA
jgi:flavodoxin